MTAQKKEQSQFSATVRKDGIISIVEKPTATENSYKQMRKKVLGLCQKDKDFFLIDLRKGIMPSVKSRKIISEMLRTCNPVKIAFVQNILMLRIMAKFIMLSAGIRKFKFFGSEKEALQWLKK